MVLVFMVRLHLTALSNVEFPYLLEWFTNVHLPKPSLVSFFSNDLGGNSFLCVAWPNAHGAAGNYAMVNATPNHFPPKHAHCLVAVDVELLHRWAVMPYIV